MEGNGENMGSDKKREYGRKGKERGTKEHMVRRGEGWERQC